MRELFTFIKLLKEQKKMLFISIIFSFLSTLSSILLLSLSGWFITTTGFIALSGIIAAQKFNYLYPVAAIRSFSFLRIFARYLERVTSHELTFKILTDIRIWLYKKLINLAPLHLRDYKSGDLLSRLVDDVNNLDNLYIRILSPSIVLFFIIITTSFILSFFSLKLSLITTILFLVASIIIPIFSGKLSKNTARKIVKSNAFLKTTITDHIQSLAELKIFSANNIHTKLIEKTNENLIYTQKKMSYYKGLNTALVTIFLGLTLLIGLWISIDLTHRNNLNGSFIAAIGLFIIGTYEAILPLPLAFQYLGSVSTSAKRLVNITKKKPNINFNKHSSNDYPKNNSISFTNISFGYPLQRLIYNNFNLYIKPNEKIAISGATGCGKTTLINLLIRFWKPQSGKISIGNIDISKFHESFLRQQITLISQKSHIFNGSIRENLMLANLNATETELWNALKIVYLDDFVRSLPKKIDTWTGEYGQHLSKGQKQRLSLARAVLSKKPILILDEPTEGLDIITEKKVINTIYQIMSNKTVIIVTHNKSLLNYVDRVISMKLY